MSAEPASREPSKESLERARDILPCYGHLCETTNPGRQQLCPHCVKALKVAALLDAVAKEAALTEHHRTCESPRSGKCLRCFELGDEKAVAHATAAIREMKGETDGSK